MLFHGKEVPPVPGHKNVDSGLDRAYEDQVVVRIASKCFRGRLRGWLEKGGRILQQRLNIFDAFRVELEFLRKDSGEFDRRRLKQSQGQLAVDH